MGHNVPVLHANHYAPPSGHPLRPFIYGIWQIRVDHSHWHQRVLPRGIVDLVFPLEGQLTVTGTPADETRVIHETPFLVGLQSRTVSSEAKGGLLLLGLSLKVETSRAILALPAHELSDLTVPAEQVLPGTKHLLDRLQDAPAFRERCDLLMRWLERSIRMPDRLSSIARACSVIGQPADGSTIDHAANSLGYTTRHLRRVFLDFVGTAPGDYMRLRRFNTALRQMRSPRNLTDIALAAGYYDQAHFCREFKDFAGLTPTAYRAQAGAVPGILFSPDVRSIQSPDERLA
jgi:AraC-like DNA-binding protein